ncbi:MAG: fused response regulator/phosphatase [Desulfamplus sp.]|nr:fused response regulator/phosphatase [Desulfamplus sp.]
MIYQIDVSRNKKMPMKALVVDDDSSNRLLLEALLEQNNYETYMAQNGIEGIEIFKKVNPDIVLMDIMMPLMDGYDATRLIKAYSGENFVPVIILTTLNDPEDMAKAIDCGADDFMSKPIHTLVLKAKIIAMERLRQLYHNLNIQNRRLKSAIEEIESSKQQLEQYSTKLEFTNAKLELLNNKMRREHDAASNMFKKVIQHNKQSCVNVKHSIISMETFSGDIVLSRLQSSGNLYLLVGDFAGHGLLAAIGALPVSDIFNDLTDSNQPISRFVFDINKKLKELLPPAVFLCAAVLELNFDKNLMSVWNGGLPDILLVGTKCGIKQKIKSQHPPLGIIDNKNLNCDIETYCFDSEDYIYLFSDGVTETFNPQNEMYGQERLEANFRWDNSIKSKYDPDTILDQIRQSIDDFRGTTHQSDDITMVQIRCSQDFAS